jgi:hypothetical protein
MNRGALSENPIRRFKFPVLASKFPVLFKKFPVPLSREFGSKTSEIIVRMGCFKPRSRPKFKNSLFFSLLAGNLVVETGSTATASATTHSHIGSANGQLTRSLALCVATRPYRESPMTTESITL